MRIIANRSRCVGHARCAAVSEGLFVLDDNGYVGFETVVVPAAKDATALKGARSCPERALRIEQDAAAQTTPPVTG